MRLSDYIKGGQKPKEPPAPSPHPAPEQPPGEQKTAPPEREKEVSGLHQPTGYDLFQSGILEAAAQLGISTSRPKDTVTERSAKCLAMVFEKFTGDEDDYEAVWAMVQSVAAELEGISREGNSFIPQYLNGWQDDRLLVHSVYTAVFAMEIAVAVEHGLDTSVTDIGAAALLHDAGFLRMKDGKTRFINEFDRRNAEHVKQSVQIARQIGAPTEVVRIIEQHHERCDGEGFPAGLNSEQIGRSSQVLGIANVLETSLARSASINDTENRSIFDVLVEWRKAFDHDLLKSVLSRKGFYSVGEMVELTNRSICQVVHLNPGFPLRPVVKVIVDGSGNHPDVSKLIDLKDVGVLAISRKIT